MKKKELYLMLGEMTPKEKALFICKNWSEPYENSFNGEKPRISRKTVQAIENSLTTKEEKKDFYEWIAVSEGYRSIEDLFGLGYTELLHKVESLITYLYLWEAYEQEEDTINALLQAVKDSGSERSLELFKAAVVGRSCLRQAKIKQEPKEEYFYIDIFGKRLLYDEVKERAEAVKMKYSALKAFILVIEDLAKETDSEEFITQKVKECITCVKIGTLDVPPRFCRKQLRLREETGKTITEEEKKRAVFPEYEELIVNPDLVESFKKRTNYLRLHFADERAKR